MANLNDKTKAKDGDGPQTIATVDTKDRNKPLNILPAKPSPRIRATPKEKEHGKRMGKENHLVRKVKERAEKKGNRDYAMHVKFQSLRLEEPKMTNNSQNVYLNPPTDEGDDETTIIFTSNINRIVEPANTNMEDNQETNDLTKIITGIIKTM